MSRRDALYDDELAETIFRESERIPVDVEAGWRRLVDDLDAAGAARSRAIPRLLLIAAAVAVLLLAVRPVIVSGTLATYNYVREVVGFETTTTLQTLPPTTVAPPTTTVASTTTLAPPTTTTTAPPPPPPTTTTAPTPAPAVAIDSAHAKITDGNQYRLEIRRVHDKINAAVGFGRTDYEALQGGPEILEKLIGQKPTLDAQLRDTIGHLRQARDFNDFEAAKAAHRIIENVERQLAAGEA